MVVVGAFPPPPRPVMKSNVVKRLFVGEFFWEERYVIVQENIVDGKYLKASALPLAF